MCQSDLRRKANRDQAKDHGGFVAGVLIGGRRKVDLRPSDSYAISAIMVRMPGWQKAPDRQSLPIYGQQRVCVRETG